MCVEQEKIHENNFKKKNKKKDLFWNTPLILFWI